MLNKCINSFIEGRKHLRIKMLNKSNLEVKVPWRLLGIHYSFKVPSIYSNWEYIEVRPLTRFHPQNHSFEKRSTIVPFKLPPPLATKSPYVNLNTLPYITEFAVSSAIWLFNPQTEGADRHKHKNGGRGDGWPPRRQKKKQTLDHRKTPQQWVYTVAIPQH